MLPERNGDYRFEGPRLRLLRALASDPRFPITAAHREEAVAIVLHVMRHAEDVHVQLAAVRLLLDMDKVNMEQERRDLPPPP
jgi:hypothetical protein